MPTINASKKGRIIGSTVSTQAAARDAASGTHHDETDGESLAVQWFRSSGRGGGTMRYIRSFLYFDTSGVTGTVASATLKIRGAGTGTQTADVIGVKSTAFGGDGGTNLADADFNNLDHSTAYTDELAGASWNTSANNDFTLTSTALTDIKDNNAFIIALIESNSDYPDTDTGDLSHQTGINFGSTLQIDYTLATGYSHDIMGLAAASIGKVNSLATANVGKISGT